jgi:two-component system sensor histidine kinase KdpD
VYVETPKLQRLPDALRERTLNALRLAADLGAETATLAGADPIATLVGYARVRNVSKLVAGGSSRSGTSRWLRRPFGERIAERADDLDLTLIRAMTDEGSARDLLQNADASAWRDALRNAKARRSPLSAYAWAGAICAFVTFIASTLIGRIDLANLVMLYLLGVIFAAVKLGRGPGVLLSFLSVAAFDFFFVPPRLSLSVTDTQYLLTFVGMLLTSLVISHLTSSLRREASVAQRREQRTSAMYAMARELAAALTTEQIVGIGSRHVSEVFRSRVAILLPDSADQVKQKVDDPDVKIMLDGPLLDIDVGQWVYDQQKPAGHGTDTLPAAAALYLPLKAPMRTRGVLAVQPEELRLLLVPEQRRQLETFAVLSAIALERVHYVDVAQHATVQMESERLRNSLLSALSHDLRTPLAALYGLSDMLVDSSPPLPPASRETARAISSEARRMNAMVDNLLDMARLQSGHVHLNRQWQPIEEVVGSSLQAVGSALVGHTVLTDLPADLPLVDLDAVLIERVLANLLENAAKYTPKGSVVTIAAHVDGTNLLVTVEDDGPGLPAGREEALFEKFTRGDKESSISGVGLGLAISRAIVEAHQGRIWVEPVNSASGRRGARFCFVLPLGTPPGVPAEESDAATAPERSLEHRSPG